MLAQQGFLLLLSERQIKKDLMDFWVVAIV